MQQTFGLEVILRCFEGLGEFVSRRILQIRYCLSMYHHQMIMLGINES
jgi:hypothetical protein